MALLDGFRVAQIGPGLAAAVCGRLLADAGAAVGRVDPDRSGALGQHLNHGVDEVDLAAAHLIVCEGSPAALRRAGCDAAALRRINPGAALVMISPFGQTGPRAEEPASDLSLCFASGIARMLTGQVDDLGEPPMAPAGRQSAFIGGLAAACAGMHAALLGHAAMVDVSIHEALATLAITELARAGQNVTGGAGIGQNVTGQNVTRQTGTSQTGTGGAATSWSRQRLTDGNGATVCILPARDGFVAISPREDRQWAAWLRAMGSPTWGAEARFATKRDRVANWDALHALMSEWSRPRDKHAIAEVAQAAHVPSFALLQPGEHLASAQLRHRGFFRTRSVSGRDVHVPGSPFGVSLIPIPAVEAPTVGVPAVETPAVRVPAVEAPAVAVPGVAAVPGRLPLSGIRVLDFSWVIAGPTATRYLAAMGAEVIKVEAPGAGDPGRASELHRVLGQAKRGVVLDLKTARGVALAKALAARSDVSIENFATGVMDRLGLGSAALRAVNPALITVSASGMGRTGPAAEAVAYGTLLQCYAGFAGLNRHPGMPPRVGMAWLDPMCGLMLAFAVAASVWRRRAGVVAQVDFSMIEAMLWTMAEPLLGAQLGAAADAPGCVARCAGADDWVGAEVAVLGGGSAEAKAVALRAAGVAAAALARSGDLVGCAHLRARGFWDAGDAGVLPGLPWVASFGRATGAAPGLGADTEAVLRDVLGMAPAEIAAARASGALG